MGLRPPERSTLRELFAIDLRSLAAMRMAVGLLLLIDLGDRFRTFDAMYTDAGILPRWLLAELAPHAWSPIHTLSGDARFVAALFALQAALALAFAAGLRPRLTGLLSLLLLISLHERNGFLNHGADVMIRFLIFWLLFLPIGRVWSVDAWLAGEPRRGHGERVLSIGSVALLLQPWWLYVGVTVSKLQYESWHEGRAIFAVLNKAHYAQPLGEFLVQYPDLLAWLGWMTIATEGAFCVLLFLPWWTPQVRIAAFFANLFFQLGLWSCLDIGIFQPLSMAAALPFLPVLFWDRFVADEAHETVEVRDGRGPWARVQQGVCAFALIVASSSNLATMPLTPPDLPEPLPTLYDRGFLYQRWRMFANSDKTIQGWWMVVGETADGRGLSLIDDGTPVTSLARPRYYVKTLPGHHWAMFLNKTLSPANAPLRETVASHFCRDWNARAAAADRAERVKFIYMDFKHHDPAAAPSVVPVLLADRACDEGEVDLAETRFGSDVRR